MSELMDRLRGAMGGLCIVGAKSSEAQAMADRVADQTFPGVGAVARGFADVLPIEWIEATVRRRIVGQRIKGEKRLMGLLLHLLEDCNQRGACEWYTPPTVPMAAPGGDGAATDPALDMHPMAVRRRAIRASFGGSGKVNQWAMGIFDA